nr:protein S-acyltransferase 8-like [Ipomoea batatas]
MHDMQSDGKAWPEVLVLLLFTSARDPGIVPRNSHPPEEEFRYDTSADTGGRQTPSLQFPRTKEVMVNGVPVKVKYCDTCMLYRPPRCSHCSICDNCVERFDHHCPWVGQCIGLRNYRYFFCFVSSAMLLCIYVFAMCAFYIKVLMDDKTEHSMEGYEKNLRHLLFSWLTALFLCGLLVDSLASTFTSSALIRSDHRLNVYNHGCLNNFFEVFCTKVKPSRNHFRAFVQEEPPRPPLPTTREGEIEEMCEDRRAKVEDDLDIGGDLLKISQRHDIEDIEADIRSRGSDVPHHNSSEAESVIGSERKATSLQSDARHSSWERRSGSWEIAPDVVGTNANVTESRSVGASKEAYQ